MFISYKTSFSAPVVAILIYGGLGTEKEQGCRTGPPEPEFVNLLMSPGIDSQPDVPVQQPCLTFRPARLQRLAESIPGLLERLQIQALMVAAK